MGSAHDSFASQVGLMAPCLQSAAIACICQLQQPLDACMHICCLGAANETSAVIAAAGTRMAAKHCSYIASRAVCAQACVAKHQSPNLHKSLG